MSEEKIELTDELVEKWLKEIPGIASRAEDKMPTMQHLVLLTILAVLELSLLEVKKLRGEKVAVPERDFETWQEFAQSGELNGYNSWVNKFDAEVARETECDKCQTKMIYYGRKNRHEYRAFAVCPNCGYFFDF